MKEEKISGLTHLNKDDKPNMVNVGEKVVTHRIAKARSVIQLTSEIYDLLEEGDINTKKGSVFNTATLAGIIGAKKTSDLIPLCHPIALEDCKINIKPIGHNQIEITCTTSIHSKTGVEMEALTGATVAALTIYDMCKAMSHDIKILHTELLEKSGGKKDFKR